MLATGLTPHKPDMYVGGVWTGSHWAPCDPVSRIQVYEYSVSNPSHTFHGICYLTAQEVYKQWWDRVTAQC